MKLRSYLIIAFTISMICMFGFTLIARSISDEQLMAFDRIVISVVQGWEASGLTRLMKLFTFIGSTGFVIFLSLCVVIFLAKVLHHRSEVLLFVIAIIGSALLNQLLKHLFQRTRPDFHRLIEISGYSFPSGHAMNAFTVYAMLAFILWRHISGRMGRSLLIIFSIMMIIAIGVSRIYLGVHYPSDIVGGYLASAIWLSLAIFFFQYYKEKQYNKKDNVKGTV
ncbi:phosphatase PAP2 family protein [Bacillus rubiinfantis]|uniref:phosphatase PAP2 family protein n=1 Tax=Bacillus rubiinfantis TaxID=1499680 RepID=UPI0005AA7386|nr:phosphatase PAP2 family protein [Bacillus rubiinfantis]